MRAVVGRSAAVLLCVAGVPVLVVTLVHAVAAAQFTSGLRTLVLVGDAEAQTPEPRLYRVYEAPEQLTLLLTLTNEASGSVFVDQSGLERDVRFTVKRDTLNVPIKVRWNRDAKHPGRDAPIAALPGSSIRLDLAKGVEWRIDLQPAAGTRFPAGRYAIEVALGDASGYISNAAGQPRNGAALQSAPVSVIVAPAATARERASAFRLAGTIALRGNRQAEAVQAFQSARSADPTDHMSMVALGDAYVRVKRYAEAIVEFENALRVRRGPRSSVPTRLAFAYVAVGDESNAARVLREAGVSESKIPSDLGRFRSAIRARQ